jgi:WD40 repeat protein
MRVVPVLLVVVLLSSNALAQDRFDWFGDRLPSGVAARIGSVRWRELDANRLLAFSPDGKLLASGDASRVAVWEADTGKSVTVFRVLGSVTVQALAFSPDSRYLAASFKNEGLRIWDLSSGQEQRVPPEDGTGTFLAFAPDSKSLFVGGPLHITQRDRATLALLRRTTHFFGSMALAPDGRTIAAFLQRGRNSPLLLLDTTEGTSRNTTPVGPLGVLAFSPDGKTLAVVRDEDITLWDLTTEEVLQTWPSQPLNPDDSHAPTFAPEGKTLAAHGCYWSIPDGTLLGRIPSESGDVVSLVFAPDGKSVALCGSRQPAAIERWTTGIPRRLGDPAAPVGAIQAIGFSPSGKLLATGSGDGTIRVHEARTGQPLVCIPTQRNQFQHLIFSPDETLLADISGDIRIWDIATGEQLAECPGRENVAILGAAFTRDGRSLVCVDPIGVAHAWEVATGKELWSQRASAPPTAAGTTRDGTLFAIVSDGELLLWDVQTRRARSILENGLPLESRKVSPPIFSPDGKLLLAGSGLWDVPTGRLLRPLNDPDSPLTRARKLALSADGRNILASAYGDRAGVWEIASGSERLPLPHLAVRGGTFAPDGKSAAIYDENSLVIVWDTMPQATAPPETALPGLWDDLAGSAPGAFQAIQSLRAAGSTGVAFLGERQKPARFGKADLARLIDQLDDDDFDVRERATVDLGRLGSLALGALRETARNKDKPEAASRARTLLQEMPTTPPGDLLRSSRVIEALEQIGTTEARKVLERLAGGAEGAPETEYAQAALRRMK